MRRTAALFLAGLAVSTIQAQTPNERLRGQQNQPQGSHSGSHAQMHHLGVDREAAIGHALCMSIEGSSLWHCAQKVEAKEAKPGSQSNNQNQAMRNPEAILEQHAREAFQ